MYYYYWPSTESGIDNQPLGGERSLDLMMSPTDRSLENSGIHFAHEIEDWIASNWTDGYEGGHCIILRYATGADVNQMFSLNESGGATVATVARHIATGLSGWNYCLDWWTSICEELARLEQEISIIAINHEGPQEWVYVVYTNADHGFPSTVDMVDVIDYMYTNYPGSIPSELDQTLLTGTAHYSSRAAINIQERWNAWIDRLTKKKWQEVFVQPVRDHLGKGPDILQSQWTEWSYGLGPLQMQGAGGSGGESETHTGNQTTFAYYSQLPLHSNTLDGVGNPTLYIRNDAHYRNFTDVRTIIQSWQPPVIPWVAREERARDYSPTVSGISTWTMTVADYANIISECQDRGCNKILLF